MQSNDTVLPLVYGFSPKLCIYINKGALWWTRAFNGCCRWGSTREVFRRRNFYWWRNHKWSTRRVANSSHPIVENKPPWPSRHDKQYILLNGVVCHATNGFLFRLIFKYMHTFAFTHLNWVVYHETYRFFFNTKVWNNYVFTYSEDTRHPIAINACMNNHKF